MDFTFQNKDDWSNHNKRQSKSPERTIQGQFQFESGLRQQPRPQYPPVQYPGQSYYQNFYPGQYNQGYRQPYEEQYGYNNGYQSYNPQPYYPYRPIQQPVFQPPPPPQAPPQPRESGRPNPDYRRESFSVYSTSKKKAKSSDRTQDRVEEPQHHSSPRPRSLHFEPQSPRNRRQLYEPDSPRFKARDENKVTKRRPKRKTTHQPSDYEDISDIDHNLSRSIVSEASIETVTSLLNRSYISARRPNQLPRIIEDDQSDSEETYINISEQEKKDYFKRLELVYKTLDEYLEMPEAKQKPGTSLARGKVMIQAKPSALPPASFIDEKYDEYLGRAQQAIETVEVKKPKTKKDSEQQASEQVKVMSQNKPKLGFDRTPFNPKWLYNIDKPSWPDKVKPEEDITLLTYDNELPDDEFSLKRRELHHIQQATAITMNTVSHIDWMLAALRKLVTEAQRTDIDNVPILNAIEDLLDGTAYANEFLTEQQIYIHAGITNHMRTSYIKQMEDMTPGEINELTLQPYNAAAAFNGQIPYVVKNILDRESRMAFKRLARQNTNPQNQGSNKRWNKNRRPRRRPRKNNTNNSNGLGSFINTNYGNKSSASKGGNRNSYSGFDKHGRQNNNQQRNRNQWQQNSTQNFQSRGFQQRGRNRRNRNQQSHNQGNRNRDFFN